MLEQLKTLEAPFVLSEKEVKVAPFSKGKESLIFVNKKDFGRTHLWDSQPNAMTSEKQFESFLFGTPC